MFYGHLHSPDTYQSLIRDEALLRALAWIRQMPSDQAPGIYEIQGEEIFVNVHGYDTLPPEQCRFESHRKYIDIQYCIAGSEFIDIQWASRLTPDGEFDPAKDLQFYSTSFLPREPETEEGEKHSTLNAQRPTFNEPGTKNQEPRTAEGPNTSLHMTPGDFAIFFPEDAHRPKVRDGLSPSVRKLVVKIDRSLLGKMD